MLSKVSIDELFVNCLIFVIMFYPPLGMFNLINPLLLFYFVVRYYKFNKSKRRSVLPLFFFLLIVLSFTLNASANPTAINFVSVSQAIMISLILVFFPLIPNFKLYDLTVFVCTLYLLFSQICYSLNISYFISFFDTFYPYEGSIISYSSDYLQSQTELLESNLRLGGLFHNPNHCSRIYTFLLAIFTIEHPRYDRKKILLLGVMLFGIVLTGSRTGLIIALCIIILDYYLKTKDNFLVFILTAIGILTIFVFDAIDFGAYRAFSFSAGSETSLSSKFTRFFSYMEGETNALFILFGHFDLRTTAEYLTGNEQLDSEWAYMIFSYGIFSIFVLLLFYFNRFREMTAQYRIIALPLLWCVTSTILLAHRISLLYFILFSIYYQRSMINRVSYKHGRK